MTSATVELWKTARESLQEIIDKDEFDAWFLTLDVQSYDAADRSITLVAASDFYVRWLTRKYQEQIRAVFEDILGHHVHVEITADHVMDTKESRSRNFDFTPLPNDRNAIESNHSNGAAPQTPYDRASEARVQSNDDSNVRHNLNPKYQFEDFVVGESNRYAHAAARSVADPDSSAFNPLFIYGPSGLGKTHLMQAIGHGFARKNPDARILYVTSEQFVNGFIESIQGKDPSSFRNQYRKVDVLLLDDVQFLIGKERTQLEIFHTFNDLFDAGKKIVLTSDRPPKELTTLEDRLRSRFEWGVIADMAPPDLETRIAILRQKAIQERLTMPDEVIAYIAEYVTKNIRELEGALKRIKVYASLHNCAPSIQAAQEVLKPLMNGPAPTKVSIDQIQQAVCNLFQINVHQLTGSNRSKKFSYPRHVALYLSRELTDLSFPDIAQKFGGKDHTSVIYACRKIKNQMSKDEKISNAITRLMDTLQTNKSK